MTTSLWTKNSGLSLGIIPERITATIPLPVNKSFDITSVTKISGHLPPGLRLSNDTIYGTPFEVSATRVFHFVLRATTSDNQFQDRTYSLTVEGADEPQWLTAEGILEIGPNDTLFVLDTSVVDYQLMATDTDLPAGDILEYFIKPGNGELPGGIRLTSDGRLIGVVDPILSLDKDSGSGHYDSNKFAGYPYDFGALPSNGYASYNYDAFTYEYSVITKAPKKLNRFYEFIVSVTDGETIVDRKFRMYIVGDDFLRVDNTFLQSSSAIFSADNTHLRTPLWLTPSNLGFKRANNYVTLFLDILESPYFVGGVQYTLEDFNDDGSRSKIPPGLVLDQNTGELAGTVPYQPAITEQYKFTVTATRYTGEIDSLGITGTFYEDTLMGQTSFKIFKLEQNQGGIFSGLDDGINDLQELKGRIISLNDFSYKVIGVDGSNQEFDIITLDRTLNPEISLVLSEEASTGQDFLYVDRLAQASREKLTDRKLNFNASESHLIQRIVPYVKWEIKSRSGANIEIDFSSINADNPTQGETLEQQIKRIFNQDDTFVNILGPSLITVETPANSNSTINIIEKVFVSGDSTSNDIRVTKIFDGRDRIFLDSALNRSIANGNNIGIALFERESFEKSVSVVSKDETVTPSSSKTFTINILGEVDSTITWNTDTVLGTIRANNISIFSVNASSTVPNARLLYTLVDGVLPPGLSLTYDGEITGRVRQFAISDELRGLTTFDNGNLIFDEGLGTTIDRQFKFTVDARDRFGYSATTREFTINVLDPSDLLFSNVYLKPMLKQEQRRLYRELISDPNIFSPELIYKPSNPDFGLQLEIKMLAYAGIETKNVREYVSAAAKNHKKKRYTIGELKKAVAKEQGTNDVIYEVIYLEVIDPYEPKDGKTRKSFSIKNTKAITADTSQHTVQDDSYNESFRFRNSPSENIIKADSDAVFITSKDDTRYISNISNMRDQIKSIGETDKEFLPLWMRTAQENEASELGFILAIPICYCKAGTGDQIMLNLKNRNFDFSQIDLEIDRYIIDSTTDVSVDQFILFANYQYNI